MSERLLPRFHDSLMAGKIIPDKYVTYHAYWVGSFLAFANKNQNMKPRDRGHYFSENVRYLLFTNKFVI